MPSLAQNNSSDRLFVIVLFTAAIALAGFLVLRAVPLRSASQNLAEEALKPGAVSNAGPVSPAPYPAVRYQELSAKSPFAIATAAALPTAAPTPGFAANLYVSGVARIGTSEFVTIKSRADDKTLLFLQAGRLSPDGIKVERLDWSDEPGKSKVFVSKGGENATLTFDETAMKAVVAAPPAPMLGRGPILPGGRPMQLPGPGGQPPGFFGRQRMIPPGGIPQIQPQPGGPVPIHRRAIIPSGQ